MRKSERESLLLGALLFCSAGGLLACGPAQETRKGAAGGGTSASGGGGGTSASGGGGGTSASGGGGETGATGGGGETSATGGDGGINATGGGGGTSASGGGGGSGSTDGGADASTASDDLAGPFPNSAGASTNLSSTGSIDRTNAFFRGFGNGRACVTCHRPEDGFSLTPRTVQALFKKCGLDSDAPPPAMSDDERAACALFRTNDGSNSSTADVSTAAARKAAYSLLLSKAVFHLTFPIPDPAKRQFEIVEFHDPYGVATKSTVSVYRRPLASTNLSFEKGVMWDLRETSSTLLRAPFTPDITNVPALAAQLKQQAIDATLGHAQAMAPGLSDAEATSIVAFESALFSAQTRLDVAGDLASGGATGGLLAISKQKVTPICANLAVYSNNPDYPQCQQYTYDPKIFTLFDAWQTEAGSDAQSAMRASIARGQILFNTRKVQSPDKRDAQFYDHSGDNKNTTCGTCHSDSNTGGGNGPIGFANQVVGVGASSINSPNKPVDFLDRSLPTYTLRCNANGMAAYVRTGGLVGCHDRSEPGIPVDEVTVNDPGRSLITGGWASVAAFKVKTLRNLSARAPYFHDGSEATLAGVVEHYKQALGFEFTDAEKQDLVNFLSAL